MKEKTKYYKCLSCGNKNIPEHFMGIGCTCPLCASFNVEEMEEKYLSRRKTFPNVE
jgi:Zn finger protein HypA/HybF involved in hydrogenase expression